MPAVKIVRQRMEQNGLFYLAAILIALAVKHHYSQAGAGDLGWILTPTANMVSLVTGDGFRFEAGAGYVCDTQRIIIAPACAGVNFMLMAFGMSVFAGVHHMKGRRHRFGWLMFSLAASYGLALLVNTLRIVISIHTYHADFSTGSLPWAWVHRLEGVVIYFFFLYLFYSMIRGIIKRYTKNEPGRGPAPNMENQDRNSAIRKALFAGLIPCAWYLSVTLAVPFLNGAPSKAGGRFYEHAAMVLGLCLTTWICIAAVTRCGRKVRLLFNRRSPET